MTPSAPQPTQTADGAEPQLQVGQTIRNVFGELWRYRWIIPAVTVLVTALVTFWVQRQPRIYEAQTTMEYDPRPAQPLGHTVEDVADRGNYWEAQEVFQTQNVILRSRSLAERVVRKLGLQQNPDFLQVAPEKRASFQAISSEEAAAVLQGRIEVSPIRDTRLIRLIVRDRDPDRAQLLVNTLAETFIEKSLEDRLGTSAHALEWLGSQMQSLKHDLEASELALYNFRESHDSLSASLEERQKIIASQLQRYSDALTDIHTRRVETEARLSVLRDVLARPDLDPLAVQAGPLAEDDAIMELRGKYREAAADLEKMLVIYDEAHPQVLSARAELEGIAAQVRSHLLGILGGVETHVKELEHAEQGIQRALSDVNHQGLALSLQQVQYERLDRERKNKNDLYNLVMERTAQTDLTRALRVANARVVDRAVRPGAPVSPQVRMLIVLGALFGLGLGLAAALLAAQLDNKVRSVGDIESRGLTVLGVIPSVESGAATAYSYSRQRRARGRVRIDQDERDLIVHHEPRSTVAECFRTIRTNLTFQAADRQIRTLAVTSAMPREGKSTISISVAIALAQSGKRVLLVDADLRKPRLRRAFKVAAGAGLTSVLVGETSFDEAVCATDVPSLTLLQCGPIPPNPSELLHTRRFADLIQEAKSKFDVVVFDSPPVGAVTDPVIISSQVDATMLVVRSRNTTRGSLEAAMRQLRGVAVRLVGVVLNDVDLSSDGYGSYYAYYRGYYAVESDPSEPPAREAPTRT